MKQKQRKIGRKLLSFLLALALVLGLMPGMMPGMRVTVNAENSYNFKELTLADLEGKSDFNEVFNALGGLVSYSYPDYNSLPEPSSDNYVRLITGISDDPDFVYMNIYNDGKIVNAGTNVSLNNGYVKIRDSMNAGYKYYYIAPVSVNSVSLNKSSTTLTAGKTETLTATVLPDNATYKTVKWSVSGTNSGAVKLYTDADCITEVGADATETLTVYAKGESAGSATITCTSSADNTKTASCDVTVNKAAPTVTAPTAKTELVYTSSAQKLVNTGSTNDGILYYAVTTENTAPTDQSLYKTDIPTATDAGTYYVWYKVIGDKNHLDTEAEPIEVKIDKGKGAFPKPANISLWSSDMACVDAVDGQEYVIVEKGGEPDWTKAVTGDEDGTVIFEGLQPYTEYDIYTKVKETENVYTGEAVSTAFLTDLAGFSVEGDTYVGETLTITTDPEDTEGLSYKWYYVNIVEEDEGYRQTELGDAIEGAEGATYTLTEDDYGKYICVVIYRGDKEYDRSSEYGPVEYDPEKISYRNTEGAGGEWTKGSSDSLQMTFKRSVVDSETFDHFKGILVDGKAVNASDYTAEAGSVIIKLNPSYLETLTVGEHVLTAQFDDGEDAEATFTIANADKTDDEVDEPEEEKADDAKVDEPEEEKADDAKVDEPEEEKADDAKIEEPEPEKPVQEAPADNTPKTSDNMNVPGVLFVMDLALLGMIVVMLLIGREKKKRR
ncbi:MAG: Ig-like domain-containing protein [Eubacterium sp.]|nr:Ig-like domain-containing protein [Eubacterium sp.]